MSRPSADLAGVVLAAGRGSRMSPLTDLVPKPLLTVNNTSLLELALRRVSAVTDSVAVNAHHLADQIAAAARGMRSDVHVSFERERLLGTAGALYQMRDWIAGRPVLVANSDVWLSDAIGYVVAGWDGRRPRLLVIDKGEPSDFGTFRFTGVSLLPARTASELRLDPDGLYSAVWRNAYDAGELEYVQLRGQGFDCGTPAEFLTANLHAAGQDSVVAPDAVVKGRIQNSVILAGARVDAGEHLVTAIRDRFGHTVFADPVGLL